MLIVAHSRPLCTWDKPFFLVLIHTSDVSFFIMSLDEALCRGLGPSIPGQSSLTIMLESFAQLIQTIESTQAKIEEKFCMLLVQKEAGTRGSNKKHQRVHDSRSNIATRGRAMKPKPSSMSELTRCWPGLK